MTTVDQFKTRHIGLAILFLLFLLLTNAGMYFGGLVIGIMATDSCPSNIDTRLFMAWLFIATPMIIVLASLIPPYWFYKGRQWLTVVLSLFIPAAAFLLCSFIYLAIVASLCS